MAEYKIIGLMSGTSLDGVDIAHCTFNEYQGKYAYTVNACETIPYTADWLSRLQLLPSASALEYAETHVMYGRLLGELVQTFRNKHQLETDFVASHGHTIFHKPSKHYTSQIGEGAAIAVLSGLPVVCDFRTSDVAHGGQGAPLVPIGDELLFGEYDYCLNLGGFANISFRHLNQRIAYDISPTNIILNHIARRCGKAYDANGEMASQGKVNETLLKTLNALAYYQKAPPKSLGREWLEETILPILNESDLKDEDILSTLCEHIAIQISAAMSSDKFKRALVTGGGAFNTFLINRIKAHSPVQIVLPEIGIINYKEALVFAFLGLLRWQKLENCLSSVTGAIRNNCSGAIYLP